MKFILYTNSLSEHQIPLAREIVSHIGSENFRYVYTGENSQKFQESFANDAWIVKGDCCSEFESTDVMLIGGIRPIDLIERRLEKGLTTLYMSERWFKPIYGLPGWVRMFVPSYWNMAQRFVRLFNSPSYRFLPIGPWSKRDMLLICKLFGQKVQPEQIIDWGDFVSPSQELRAKTRKTGDPLKVLWVGRTLRWKRVDTIRKAVNYLKKKGFNISFSEVTGVPMQEVRKLMREHDVYVLASDATEGWGCVVPEAIEEGMRVLGTYEAGASAAILPESNLFHAGDWKTLAKKLAGDIPYVPIGKWSAKAAAERLLKEIGA